uniref:Uncharacterized protein n=1 Tax=Ditylenchus dipsaci TaxID=166011 RepID=A0A915EKL1_9BILA
MVGATHPEAAYAGFVSQFLMLPLSLMSQQASQSHADSIPSLMLGINPSQLSAPSSLSSSSKSRLSLLSARYEHDPEYIISDNKSLSGEYFPGYSDLQVSSISNTSVDVVRMVSSAASSRALSLRR